MKSPDGDCVRMRLGAWVGLLFAFATGCKPMVTRDNAAAIVDGVFIPKSDFEQRVGHMLAPQRDASGAIDSFVESRLRADALNALIDEEIIRAKAQTLKVSLGTEEREALWADKLSEMGGPEKLASFVEANKTSEALERRILESKALRSKLLNQLIGTGGPTEQELKEYFESRISVLTVPARSHVHVMLCRVPSTRAGANSENARHAARGCADKALKRLKNNETFSDVADVLAKENPQDKMGDMGLVVRGTFPVEVEEVLEKLQIGQVSPVIETGFAFYVVQVTERVPATLPSLDSMRNELVDDLRRKNRATKERMWIETFRSSAKVERLVETPLAGTPGARGK